jgi:hypothetical protein
MNHFIIFLVETLVFSRLNYILEFTPHFDGIFSIIECVLNMQGRSGLQIQVLAKIIQF